MIIFEPQTVYMKHTLLYILFISLFGLIAHPAHAGFFVKKATIISTKNEITNVAATQNMANISASKNTSEIMDPNFRGIASQGWFGLASVLFGLAGFIYPLFSLLAILFGFLGMSRKNHKVGLAIFGCLLGLTVLALTIFGVYTP